MSKNAWVSRLRKKTGYALFLVILLLAAAEITLRLMGHQPLNPQKVKLVKEGGGSLFEPDQLLGYKPVAGVSKMILNDSLHFTMTHDSNAVRVTVPAMPDSLPQIWIFGCSFTHGYGVNDDETYASVLQEMMPGYKVMNFGVSGYGMHHANYLLDWMTGIKGAKFPEIIVLAYGGFHDQRTVASPFWMRAISGRGELDSFFYPWSRMDDEGEYRQGKEKIGYKPFPFSRYLAVSTWADEKLCDRKEKRLKSREATSSMIFTLNNAAIQNHTKVLVAGIWNHPDTQSMLKLLTDDGIQNTDISVNTDDPALRILPGDPHPNADAHRQMGEKLYAALLKFL